MGFLRYKIDNKYQKAKRRGWIFKNTILKKRRKRKKKNKATRIIKQQQQPQIYIYGICFKNRVFFLKSNNRL